MCVVCTRVGFAVIMSGDGCICNLTFSVCWVHVYDKPPLCQNRSVALCRFSFVAFVWHLQDRILMHAGWSIVADVCMCASVHVQVCF